MPVEERQIAGFGGGAEAVDVDRSFDLDELWARVRTMTRGRQHAGQVRMGTVTVDFVSQTARRGSQQLNLSDKEFKILRYLAERQGQLVTRDELLREVWGYPQLPFTRSVDVAIARLRKKIEADVHHPRFIRTVHGDGYRFTPAGNAEGI